MKKIITIICIATVLSSVAQAPISPSDPNIVRKAQELVSQMTLDEKISYLSGETSFSLRPIERLGIKRVLLADGPQGIRNHAPHSTLYPCGIALAATWNRNLADLYGKSIGSDAKARNVSILLGPGVNMYRAPMCGRNYEYMGEDPYLTSEIAKHYIIGVQSNGVIATIKHFAANNQEWNRHHVSSDIDERTLQEIYFPAFRKAVQEAKVGAVMNSYNLLNGVHATENAWLNTEILRNQWGFDGILMSDWTSTYSTVGVANSGLDLEMPKGKFLNAEKLMPAIENGLIDPAVIDLKVQHLLQTLLAFGAFDDNDNAEDLPLDNPKSRQAALDIAREGIVLLKNDGGLLPLRGKTVILGPNAHRTPTGGGSGFVSPFSSTSAAEGLKALRPKTVMLTDDVLFSDLNNYIFTDSTLRQKGFSAQYFNNQKFEGKPNYEKIDTIVNFNWEYASPGYGLPDDHFSVRWQGYLKPQCSGTIRINIAGDDGYRVKINDKVVTGDWGNHAYSTRQKELTVVQDSVYKIDIEYFENISTATIAFNLSMQNDALLEKTLLNADNVVLCTGFDCDIEGEGFDRPFALSAYQEDFINKVAQINPNLTVVLNAGGGVDMTRWKDAAKAIIMAWYTGQEWGTALAEVLTGKTNPSGKLPISIECQFEDNPCYGSYYQNSENNELKRVEYSEGIFTGYRGYDRNGIRPLFPFGYGLSYTTFEYSNLEVKPMLNRNILVAFDIKNTGKRKGADVAQIYVRDCESSVPMPVKQLKEFVKVELNPGETKHVEVILTDEALSFYNSITKQWTIEPGSFDIMVGNSSDNIIFFENIAIGDL